MRDDFERVLCGPDARGLYESNYLKANDPDGGGAFWIKYNLMAPKDPSLPRSAELWAIVWRGPGRPPVVTRDVVRAGAGLLRTSDSAVDIHTDLATLTADRAHGSLESGGHRVAWDLSLEGDEPPIFHNPYAAMYRLPVPSKKLMTARPRLEMSGTVEVDGEQTAVDRWVGLRGHNWGTEHPLAYAYCNANLWNEPGRLAFDAFSGRIRLGSAASPWLSAAVLRTPASELRFNGLARLVNRSARVEFPFWACTFHRGGETLRVRCSLDSEDVAGLLYLSPDGRVSHCYNTKYAKLELALRRRGRDWDQRSSGLAELEFLTPEPIPGVPLHGDDVLPR